MRVLCLPTDGYGGEGGIAQHCRHLLSALAVDPRVNRLVAVPRLLPVREATVPRGISYVTDRPASHAGYLWSVLRHGLLRGRWDAVVTEHIHLLPVASLIAWMHRARLSLVIHGVESWKPPPRYAPALIRRLLTRLDTVIAVSSVTRDRFIAWSAIDPKLVRVVPNALEPGLFSPGPRPADLARRYQLGDGPVIMTLGRLSASERSKGVEEVIRTLPSLLDALPDIRYLVVGDGDDLQRLRQLAGDLGVTPQVIFTGRIDEQEKADHYRLADAYVMVGRLEGFGYVFLEAMASGLPAVGSRLDGSREPLQDGRLGLLVDPDEPEEIRQAIVQALKQKKAVPPELESFSMQRFNRQIGCAVLGER